MYKIGGVILILISFVISFNNYKKFDALHNGKEVEVIITNIPVSCEVSNKSLKPYFKFSYNQRIYTKNIEGKYCDILKNTRTLKLKTNFDNSIFVYTDETLIMDYITIIILLLIGILFLLKKEK